jgi:isoamylase
LDVAHRHAGLIRFVSLLAALRRAYPVLRAERFYTDAEIQWFGADGERVEWHAAKNRLGCVIWQSEAGLATGLCLLFNASLEPCRFALPNSPAGPWLAVIDTAAKAPNDIAPSTKDNLFAAPSSIALSERSTLVLVSA